MWYGKMDFEGNILWLKAVGLGGLQSTGRSCILSTHRNSLLIVGSFRESSSVNDDGWIVEVSSATGEFLHSKVIGNSGKD